MTTLQIIAWIGLLLYSSGLLFWYFYCLGKNREELTKLIKKIREDYATQEIELKKTYAFVLNNLDVIATRISADPELSKYHTQIQKLKEHIYNAKVKLEISDMLFK